MTIASQWTVRRFGFVRVLLLVSLCLFTANCLIAQVAGNGELLGTIKDPSGAVVSGASVTAINQATGIKTSTESTGAGYYVLSPLAPGRYTVSARAQGFKTLIQQNLTITTLTVSTLNLTLQVGVAQQRVTVTAAPPALNTSNGTLGIAIGNKAYMALPLAMAGGPLSADGIITLLPGVQSYSFPGGGFNINGGEADSNQIYVNGLPSVNNQDSGNDASLNLGFPVDTIDQFQIDTSGTPAQFQGQGAENFELKSGTNQIHGDLYEYLRNTVFDAAGYFNPKAAVEKQNEFGGSVGGPLFKNRVFYFGNYDGFRFRELAQPSFDTLPTLAQRKGDFSNFPEPIYDPATTQCDAAGACTRQQFSYNGAPNVIPPSRISSISSKLASALPSPTNSQLTNNYLNSLSPGVNQDRFLVKVDATLTDHDKIYGFVDRGKFNNPSLPPGATSLPVPYASSRYTRETADMAGFGYTHVFSPHLINELNVEYNRLIQGTVNPTAGGDWADKIGLENVPPGQASDVFPPINFGGPNAPTSWDLNSYTSVYRHTNNTYGLGDSLQWSVGSQNLIFGTQISYEQVGQDLPSSMPAIDFTNSTTGGFDSSGTLLPTTGSAYASFLLGDVESAHLSEYPADLTSVGFTNTAYSAYVQDDWKATDRLTLNLGLRYDIYTPMVEQHGRESWLNPNEPNPAVDGYHGALEFAGNGPFSCHCGSILPTYFGNVGPRVGFAYAINKKTVVRGAFGMFYIQGGGSGGSAETLGMNQLGYSASPSFSSLNGGISPAFNWNDGIPPYIKPPFFNPTLNTGFNTTNPSGGSITSYGDYYRATRAPYAEDWNLTVERQLGPVILDVSYSASSSHFLPTRIGEGMWSNEIEPQYLALKQLLTAPATSASIAAAQAIIPGVHLPYANFQGTIGQMLAPFPQYAGLNDNYPLNGNSSYNSLQVSAQKRFSGGLTFLLSYTFAKAIGTVGTNNILGDNFLSSGRSTYLPKIERAVELNNIPNTFVASYVYALPFGAGHRLGSGNPVLRTLVSHWQISGIQRYSQGTPLGPFGAGCNTPYAGTCFASYNPDFHGSARINGSYGSGYVKNSAPRPYINRDAFINPPAYTFGNTPRTQPYNLHNPPVFNENFSLLRSFPIGERMSLQLRASAFNAFNRTDLGGINTDINSSSFGTVSGQITAPRKLQFNARLEF